MTPLQYQKKLRLLEARRMIPAQGMKVGSAAYATDYESPSQFSREYARMFGLPPKQDATTGSLALEDDVVKPRG
ncbi:helix-turn-helix protein [Biostraticola tofi]|uniref:Helix-turn-helix protein n=2 Tax=Biostraticola tofi TaxID=466109 RepID=A0A4R3YR24_9GAMM|nr:helix-turn-helix protein [Biostraticola tofi]